MSKHKHNYSQYSNKPKNENPKVTVTEELLNPITEVVMSRSHPDPVGELGPMGVDGIGDMGLVNETVETKTLPDVVIGMVVGCAKLNVRAEANLFSDIVCTLNSQSEIEINVNKSTKDWFYICTATGVEGYCLRKYVEAHL